MDVAEPVRADAEHADLAVEHAPEVAEQGPTGGQPSFAHAIPGIARPPVTTVRRHAGHKHSHDDDERAKQRRKLAAIRRHNDTDTLEKPDTQQAGGKSVADLGAQPTGADSATEPQGTTTTPESATKRRRDRTPKPSTGKPTPDVIFMDPDGVGHKTPDKSKTPSVLHMDSDGVGHSKPDGSKAPSVMFMDPDGVGHKKADQSTTPSVLHMDDKGVGHAKTDDIDPGIKGALDDITTRHGEVSVSAATLRDNNAKMTGFANTAASERTKADTATKAAKAVWTKIANDSVLIAAQQADIVTTAKATVGKAFTDSGALAGEYVPASNALKTRAAWINNTASWATKLTTAKASPMTAAAIADIKRMAGELTQFKTEWTTGEVQRATDVQTIGAANTDVTNWATAVMVPLQKGPVAERVIALLQQKINTGNGGTGRISVTGVFDADTEAALKRYQKSKGLAETGIADVATVAQLDKDAPSAKTLGSTRTGDDSKADTGTPEGGRHPTLKFPTKGGAVSELQNRLNNWVNSIAGKKPFKPLSVDGMFGIKTRSAVIDFQKAQGLKADAVVEDLTWAELDKQGTVGGGVREFNMNQTVEGMWTAVRARYGWEITKDKRLVITVKINFTGLTKDPAVARWLQDIKDVWNSYKAVEEPGGGDRTYDIEFNPVVASSGHKVRVGKPTPKNPNPRSDAGNWYINDTRKGLAPHEFGHLVGLDDEYNRPEEQYVDSTGEEPKLGADAAGGGKDAGSIADELKNAIDTNAGKSGKDVSKALADVVRNEGVKQGMFARQIEKEFTTKYPFEKAYFDAVAHQPTKPSFTGYLAYKSGFDWTSDLTVATTAFSESNTSIMGTMQSAPDGADAGAIAAIAPHDHPVQPRHLRSFTAILSEAMPGTKWKPTKR